MTDKFHSSKRDKDEHVSVRSITLSNTPVSESCHGFDTRAKTTSEQQDKLNKVPRHYSDDCLKFPKENGKCVSETGAKNLKSPGAKLQKKSVGLEMKRKESESGF